MEGREIEDDVHVEVHVSRSESWDTRRRGGQGVERMEVSLDQWVADGGNRGRIDIRSAPISKNGRVDTTIKALGTDVGLGTDPIITDGLVSVEDEGVPLTSKDLDLIDN